MSISPLSLVGIQNEHIFLKDELGYYHEWTAESTMEAIRELTGMLFEYHVVTSKPIYETSPGGKSEQ